LDRADVVVVGAGTIGGWASYFAKSSGASRVVCLEGHVAGYGASSRAAGIVRAQGGTPAAVQLGLWSIDFYRSQAERLAIDSGFRALGYLLLATTDDDVEAGRQRVAMQREAGLHDVSWLEPQEVASLVTSLAPDVHRGGSYRAGDGAIDPPRNVGAYLVALQRSGVELRERTPCVALHTRQAGGGHVIEVETPTGRIVTERVILTGGPMLADVGALLGTRIPVGGVRHQVAVTEAHPAFDPGGAPMVFDVAAGLYWRPEEGGLLFGMSNPDEPPGTARSVDWAYLDEMRRRLARFVPVTRGLELRKVWAATIDYTPDHLPILGPALDAGREPIPGVTVASAGGHGMMWGPAVARAATDLALHADTAVVDTAGLGLDRFEEHGRSRLAADPIALPFPTDAAQASGDGAVSRGAGR
jgi:sarcosine oxidase subunit beta